MAELRYLPQTTTALTDEEDIKSMNKLIDLLEKGQDAKLRGLAAIALGSHPKTPALASLAQLLRDPGGDEMVGWCAVEALTQCDDPGARAKVNRLAERVYRREPDRDEDRQNNRARAIYLLGWVSQGDGIADLLCGADLGPMRWMLWYDSVCHTHVRKPRG